MEDMKEKESFIRKIYNQNYVAIANFSRAKETKNAFVIFEGDDGGTIYLTCPMNLIKCSEKKLQKLLEYIDRLYWNDIESANIFYEVIEPNQPIAGGMDGGYVTDSI